jgi:hypothetical protein
MAANATLPNLRLQRTALRAAAEPPGRWASRSANTRLPVRSRVWHCRSEIDVC